MIILMGLSGIAYGQEIYNETYNFHGGGINYNTLADAVAPLAGSNGLNSIGLIDVNFNNIKIIGKLQYYSTPEVTGTNSRQITTGSVFTKLTPFNAYVNGILYGSGQVGWQTISTQSGTQDFYYLVIFQNVNESYAHGLTGIQHMYLYYDRTIYESWVVTGVPPGGVYFNTPQYAAIQINATGATYQSLRPRTGSPGDQQVLNNFNDTLTLTVNRTSSATVWVNLSKNDNIVANGTFNSSLVITNFSGAGVFLSESPNVFNVSNFTLINDGLRTSVFDVAANDFVNRTIISANGTFCYPFCIVPSIQNTSVDISANKQLYLTGETVNLTLTWHNYDATDTYFLGVYNPNGQIIGFIDSGLTSSTTSETWTPTTAGSYYIQVSSFKHGILFNPSNVFTIQDALAVGVDSIYTNKKVYAYGENIFIYGNASRFSRIIVTPYDSQNLIERQYQTSGGMFNYSASLTTGRYFAALQSQGVGCPNPPCWQPVNATSFTVNTSGSLYIAWTNIISPSGGYVYSGTLQNLGYANISATDYIRIDSPVQIGYLNYSVSQYPYSHAVFIPATDASIGVWTAWIIHNDTVNATATLNVQSQGTFNTLPVQRGGHTQSGTLTVSSKTPCISTEDVNIQWRTQNLTNYTVVVYTVDKVEYSTNPIQPFGNINLSFNNNIRYMVTLRDSNYTTWSELIINPRICNAQPSSTIIPPGMQGGGGNPAGAMGNNLLTFMSIPAFWGFIIWVLLIYYVISHSADGSSKNAGLVGFIAANLEAVIGLWSPFTWYILVICWIGAAIFFLQSGIPQTIIYGEKKQ